MSFWAIIKNLKLDQIWLLFIWFLKYPLFMSSTIIATYYTMKIVQKEFFDVHNKHNKANAFRHALWNLLIANQCYKLSSNLDSILNWTKKITDWHEKFSPNKEMAKLMDLHNNEIGRNRFLEWKEFITDEIVKQLKSELSTAVLVKNKVEINNSENKLIYLEN